MKQVLLATLCSFIVSACGGGGGSSTPSSPSTPQDPPDQLLVKIKVENPESEEPASIVGDTFTISAAGSTGDGTLSFEWAIDEKPEESGLELTDINNSELKFEPDVDGDYRFQITLTDANDSKTDTIDIKVGKNLPPKVTISPPSAIVMVNEELYFDASNATDPEERALRHSWTVNPQTYISDVVADNTSFTFSPTESGRYVIEHTVSDNHNPVTTKLARFAIGVNSVSLAPDNTSTLSALQQTEAVFGDKSVELPTDANGDPTPGRFYIDSDSEGDHFVCELHRDTDGDMHQKITTGRRQRCEIKTFQESDPRLTCEHGDTIEMFWRFKAEDIGLTGSFTQFFQMKRRNTGIPLLSIISRRFENGDEVLRVRYHDGKDDSGNESFIYLGRTEWQNVKDKWLDVALKTTCAEEGSLLMTISDRQSQTELISIDNKDIDMWSGADIIGFKYGFYREITEHFNDEELLEGLVNEIDRVRLGPIFIESH